VPRLAVTVGNQAIPINPSIIPEANDAVQQFQSAGGQLTIFNSFGEDPLLSNPALVTQREMEFLRYHANFSEIFYTLVNGDYTLFREGIICFMDISKHLCTLI